MGFLRKMKLAPILFYPEQYSAAMQSISVVAALLVSFTYVGWLTPPGATTQHTTLIEESSCPTIDSISGTCIQSYRQSALRAYFVVNSLTFCFSMSALLAAVFGGFALDQRRRRDQIYMNCFRLAIVVILLTLSIVGGTVAFLTAAFVLCPRDFIALPVVLVFVAAILLLIPFIFVLDVNRKMVSWILKRRISALSWYLEGT